MFTTNPEVKPKIYAYSIPQKEYEGLLKIGYTTQSVEKRVKQQFNIKHANAPFFKIELELSAMRNDGSVFTDKQVHEILRLRKIKNPNKSEWFECTVEDVQNAVLNVVHGKEFALQRTKDFKMRPEQRDAVNKTASYFNMRNSASLDKVPHFLWNAKMRYGKTFASYQLAMKQGWTKILILTFKPAVQSAWEEDLLTHVDFEGWQFVSKGTISKVVLDEKKPIVCFGSFQDFLGKNKLGGIKSKNVWVHQTKWDCVILDEYHYGAWRESAKDLFESESADERKHGMGVGADYFEEARMPISTNAYLYLSGTPFRAIAHGEFIEDQIFNWTYSDEQRAKTEWKDKKKLNPYRALPKMMLLTYQLPKSITENASNADTNFFDLNTFFSAKGELVDAEFIYKEDVQKWLDMIRGKYLGSDSEINKIKGRPPLPFSDPRLRSSLQHTFWFLPNVASCYAMANLLREKHNTFYNDFNISICAGSSAGIGVKALGPVLETIDNPVETKSITLSCGKLTTGVSVKPWSGIFILRDTSSPETYFQAAFRVQTPWTILESNDKGVEEEVILKNECYVFDFSPERALRLIADYGCRLNVDENNPESKIAEFINFLPILAYDGISMKSIDAGGVLDIAMSGTTATLLARRWESPLLVHVDNNTLSILMENEAALEALMSIEGFRNVNKDIETIINKHDFVLKKQKEFEDEQKVTKKQRKEISDAEKKYKSLRKDIQDKLIKFITRIPIFMYLTDFREMALKDVIQAVEPELFKMVTGLTKNDFELLIEINLFNSELMNDAVYKFKRYEDASLNYAGNSKQKNNKIGGWDTIIEP
ncbi:GIY-YIG nuclease family protein [Candidatus Marinimicrobia bacterium]|jgi:hypothetical protein|nr:GIY-YIG nuclease family protein [Candidatus Neomarinimicrobiota bacterium]